MTKNEILLVGGSSDGKRICVIGHPPLIKMICVEPQPEKMELYEIWWWALDKEHQIPIYALKGSSDFDVMTLLVKNYRRPKDG